LHQVGGGVVAEDKAHALVGVPAVQVLGLGEVGIAAKQHPAEAAAEADGQGPVHRGGCPLVRRPVARAVDQPEYLSGVGQRQHQGVVAPGAVVRDVHALLALAGGLDQEPVHVEDGLREEGVGLCGPDGEAHVVDGVLEQADRRLGEAAAEVTCGGRVGEAAAA
jgi:hypothetical protein